MLNTKNLTDVDIELQRRLSMSMAVVGTVTLLTLACFCVFIFIDDRPRIIISGLVAIVHLIVLSFFQLRSNVLPRAAFLLSTNCLVLIMLVLGWHELDIDLCFLPLLVLPFLVFSWKEERKKLLVFLALPFVAWLIVSRYELTNASEILFGIRPFDADVDPLFLNILIRVTVAILLVIGLYFFLGLKTQGDVASSEANLKINDIERANKDLLINMSHEIRTPMTSIIGILEVLDKLEATEKQQQLHGYIRNSSVSLLKIVNDILDVSTIGSDKMKVRKLLTDFSSVVESAVISLQTIADKNGVRLELFIDPKIPKWVLVDSGRLRQVLLNLMENAIKYSAAELTGKRSNVYLSVQRGKGDLVIFEIGDQGLGISPELFGKLFGRFERGDADIIARVKGNGIGLFITKSIVEQLQGSISIQSKKGTGTIISVSLPMPAAEDNEMRVDFSGLVVEWLTEKGELPIWTHSTNLEYYGIEIRDATVSNDLSDYIPIKAENRVFIIRSKKEETVKTWMEKIHQIVINPKFIILSEGRSDSTGRVTENIYRLQLFPLLITELLDALAVLSERKEAENRKFVFSYLQTLSDSELRVRKNTKILLVEDDEINRIVIMRQLELIGFTADFAKNGEEGFAKWEKKNYDVVILDCRMPKVDGFQMATILRKKEEEIRLPRTPIIAITANILDGDVEKCFAAGMDDYISKPVNIEELDRKIAKMLDFAAVSVV